MKLIGILNSDVIQLIKLFAQKSAIENSQSKGNPLLTTNYKSSLFGFTEGYNMRKYSPRADNDDKKNNIFPDLNQNINLRLGKTPAARTCKTLQLLIF